jgi:hypothetical protein
MRVRFAGRIDAGRYVLMARLAGLWVDSINFSKAAGVAQLSSFASAARWL